MYTHKYLRPPLFRIVSGRPRGDVYFPQHGLGRQRVVAPLAIARWWHICPRCNGCEDGGVTSSAKMEGTRNEGTEDHEKEGESGCW